MARLLTILPLMLPLRNVFTFHTMKADYRPAVMFDDVKNASIIDLKAPDVEGVEKIVGY